MIPVFNEENTIVPLFENILSVVVKEDIAPFEVIFIDDGSSDGSWDRLTALYEQFPDQNTGTQG